MSIIKIVNEFKSIFEFVEFLRCMDIDELFLRREVVQTGTEEEKLVMINEEINVLANEVVNCTKCGLHRTRKNVVFGDGNPFSPVVFVGEAPGSEEDEQGLPFVGRAGMLLNKMLEKAGLRRKDVYICNVIKCHPPQNRDPLPEEIEKCSPFLRRQIEIINPRVIVTLGNYAKKVVAGIEEGIMRVRGTVVEVEGRKIVLTYHPSFLLRNPGREEEMFNDIVTAISLLKG